MIPYQFNQLGINYALQDEQNINPIVVNVVQLSVIDSSGNKTPIKNCEFFINGNEITYKYNSSNSRYTLSIFTDDMFSFKIKHPNYLSYISTYDTYSSLNNQIITLLDHSGGYTTWNESNGSVDSDIHLIIENNITKQTHQINYFNHNLNGSSSGSSTRYNKKPYIYGINDELTPNQLSAYLNRDSIGSQGKVGETLVIEPISKQYTYRIIAYDYTSSDTTTGKGTSSGNTQTMMIQIGDNYFDDRGIAPDVKIINSNVNQTGSKTGKFWYIAKIENGEIIPINYLTDTNSFAENGVIYKIYNRRGSLTSPFKSNSDLYINNII